MADEFKGQDGRDGRDGPGWPAIGSDSYQDVVVRLN